MPSIGNLRNQRGAAQASITRLATRLRKLEENPAQPMTLLSYWQHLNLSMLSTRPIHFEVIDLLDESDDLEKEWIVLDKHDDNVSTFTICLQVLSTWKSTKSPSTTNPQKLLSGKLTCLEKGLYSIDDSISSMSETAPEESMT